MQHEAPIETEIMRDLLGLVERMARLDQPDAVSGCPAKMIITTQGPTWVVEVIDPDHLRSIRVLGLTLDGTLALANALIRLPYPPWSPVSKVRALV